jgi:hypothetical protein
MEMSLKAKSVAFRSFASKSEIKIPGEVQCSFYCQRFCYHLNESNKLERSQRSQKKYKDSKMKLVEKRLNESKSYN